MAARKPQRGEPRSELRGVRYTPGEIDLLRALMPHFPEHAGSESEFAHYTSMIGALVLAAQAGHSIGEAPAYGGYAPDALAALLRPRLLPAIDFLIERGQLPSLVAPRASADRSQSGVGRVDAEADAPGIDESVAADLAGLGIDLL